MVDKYISVIAKEEGLIKDFCIHMIRNADQQFIDINTPKINYGFMNEDKEDDDDDAWFYDEVDSSSEMDDSPYPSDEPEFSDDKEFNKNLWFAMHDQQNWRYVREYLRRGGDPNALDCRKSLLYHAMHECASLKCCIVLLEAGAKVDQETYESACAFNLYEHLALFLKYGFEPPTKTCITNLINWKNKYGAIGECK